MESDIDAPLLLKPRLIQRAYLIFLGKLMNSSISLLKDDIVDKPTNRDLFKSLLNLFNTLSSWGILNHKNLSELIFWIFADQDDQLVDALFLIQALYCHFESMDPLYLEAIDSAYPTLIPLIQQQLNPFIMFYRFIEHFDFDHSDLLDLLISSETNFLLYFVSFLKIAISHWETMRSCLSVSEEREKDLIRREEQADRMLASALERLKSLEISESAPVKLVEAYEDSDDEYSIYNPLEHVMSITIKLRMQIHSLNKKNLLPYNVNPLLRLLQSLEDQYDEIGYQSEKDE